MTLFSGGRPLPVPAAEIKSGPPWLVGLAAILVPIVLWCAASPASGESAPVAEDRADELTGTVVDRNDKPVPNVDIQVYQEGKKTQQTMRTDANGHFKMPRIWRDDPTLYYALVARTKEEAGWMVPGQGLTSDGWNPGFQIKLVPFDHEILGRFTDAKGEPLAGIPLAVTGLGYEFENPWLLAGWFKNDPLFSGIRTNAEGGFRIPVPADTVGGLRPNHPSWVSIESQWSKQNTRLLPIRLSPAGQIEGTVTDAGSGKPIAGVTVGAQATSGPGGEAITDNQGKFVIGGLVAGHYNALFTEDASDPTLTAPAIEGVRVEVGKGTRVDFRAIKGRLLAGKVTDAASGKPVARCDVGYYGTARPRSGAARMVTYTDAEGKFHFHVPPGKSYVYIGDESFGPNEDNSRTLEIAPERDPQQVILIRGAPRR